MKFNLKKPCKDCPFRNDKPHQKGWLGKERASRIYNGLIGGDCFPCHKTHNYTDDELGDGQFVHQEGHQFCAGALIMLENEKTTHQSQALRMAVRLGLYNPNDLDKDSPIFKDGEEFIDWHGD